MIIIKTKSEKMQALEKYKNEQKIFPHYNITVNVLFLYKYIKIYFIFAAL